MLCVDLFDIIGADACNFNPAGDTVDAGCSGALVANGLITVLKFIAAVITGSSGMLAGSLHSLADTTNRVFLPPGQRFYKRPASEKHPFGHGKERFFRSFTRESNAVVTQPIPQHIG